MSSFQVEFAGSNPVSRTNLIREKGSSPPSFRSERGAAWDSPKVFTVGSTPTSPANAAIV